eukprot:6835273-Pyramimonas_sp.AAC.1
MVQAAPLASCKYGGAVDGANCTELRLARAMQAHLQVAELSGRSLTLLLMMSEAPRCDPAYKLTIEPLQMFAVAVWDGLLPVRMLEQGITDAVHRFSDHGNPWAGIK